jgi:hypothetical protein
MEKEVVPQMKFQGRVLIVENLKAGQTQEHGYPSMGLA